MWLVVIRVWPYMMFKMPFYMSPYMLVVWFGSGSRFHWVPSSRGAPVYRTDIDY
jgi:hypothetical protein